MGLGLRRTHLRGPIALWALALLAIFSVLWGLGQGAYALRLGDLPQWILQWQAYRTDGVALSADALVFFNLRLPRLLLGMAAGAGLALAGALMQGLFRNPLADPGLVGVSSGAALAAGFTIVLGGYWWPDLPRALGSWTLVLAAFVGGVAVTFVVFMLSRSEGGARVGVMLLAGIAINALAGAGIGLLGFLATDEQLRNFQFWMLGSLGGTRWEAVGLVGVLSAMGALWALRLAHPLNALALGEAQATLIGVNVERLKREVVIVTAICVGAVTATIGMVGFVGLVAPHLVRLLIGPDHRWVLPGSMLLGAALVILADAVARTAIQPAEMPLGILTALLGVPFFLILLRRNRPL